MDYEKEYKKLKAGITNAYLYAHTDSTKAVLESILPELKESEDELKWLTQFIQEEAYSLSLDIRDNEYRIKLKNLQRSLAWLEKQGKKEQDARYKDLEELLAADDIYQMAMNDEMVREAKEKAVNALHEMCIGRLLGIEKHGEQNLIMAKSPQLGEQKQEENEGNLGGISSNWSEEDERVLKATINTVLISRNSCEEDDEIKDRYDDELNWLKSLKDRVGCEANCTTMWKPSEKQMEALKDACDEHWEPDGLHPLYSLYEQLKKL